MIACTDSIPNQTVPTPGEDGEPQSIRSLVFDCCLGLVALGLLFVLWPILQAVRV